MNAKERYEVAAQVIERLAEKGYTMQDFSQFVRELGDREELVKENENGENLQQCVTRIICEIGVPAHIKGYQYLRCAICKAVEDSTVMSKITKTLYPTIAKEFDTTWKKWNAIFGSLLSLRGIE